MKEWYDANQWFGFYMLITSLISIMVAIPSADGRGLIGFYKKEASLFGKAVVILILTALLPAMIYVLVVGYAMFYFLSAMRKK